MSNHSKPDRREFLKNVGLAGLSSVLVAPALSGARTPAPATPSAHGEDRGGVRGR
jgi:hypothetical protein